MKVFEAVFSRSVYSSKDFPKDQLIQIAFAGRSNVGKSSMINCLLQKKKLARTSSHPGKTQSINFLRINNRFYFVDLPGYGFAKVSQKVREKWKGLIEAYLIHNERLRGLIQLIDGRVGLTENDEKMITFLLSLGINPLIVATKMDKLNQKEHNQNVNMITDLLHSYAVTGFIPFSSKTKLGKIDVWKWIETCL